MPTGNGGLRDLKGSKTGCLGSSQGPRSWTRPDLGDRGCVSSLFVGSVAKQEGKCGLQTIPEVLWYS